MKISISTPIVNLKSNNGYGYALKNICNSLKELGHEVPFQAPKIPVQLNFSQPEFYKLHRNQYQISYTPWESTVIPQRWKPFLDECDEIWTTSNWCANVFEDNGYKIDNVYPHGIDPMWKPIKRLESDKIKFLHVGEPAPRKGGQMVVDAFVGLFKDNPNYSLTIKGHRSNNTRIYNNYIDREIIGLPSMYSNINIITDDYDDEQMLDLYYSHDILVYPSYGEGFGFIPLQALATGMPTICTSGWAHYEKYLGPLKIKSTMIDSPWPFPHEGKVLEPNYQHLLETMRDAAMNFKAYSNYYFAQSNKVHQEYNWNQLTNNAFDQIFKKFS